MSQFWSAFVKNLSPYVPGEQPKMARLIKLNTNESPYGPSPKVIEAIQKEVVNSLRLYPDPSSEALRQSIAHYHTVSLEQVFVGNGSDEVLAHVFYGLMKHDLPILFPDVTYSFYPVYCGLYQIAYQQIPLTEDFKIQVDDYQKPNGGIIFPNPNAPTGRELAKSEIERLLENNPDSVVVIDEAYIDFGGTSAIDLVKKYPQLLVVQTFSKSRALAGLRVGFAIGQPHLIEALNRVKDSFNSYPIDRLAQVGAMAAIEDDAYFKTMTARIINTRQRLIDRLESLGFEIIPSSANFIFARHVSHDAADLAAQLRSEGIIVRHFKNPNKISQFLRITIGTDEECEVLVNAIESLI
jgi:histidinol-phosphate aminotransferase